MDRTWITDRMGKGGIFSYVLAVILCGIAFQIRLLLGPVEMGLQYVTFFPAVTLAAVAGGYGAGLVATAIGLALATFVFTAPYYSVSWQAFQNAIWPNIVFLVDGLTVTLTVEVLHRYRHRFAQDLAATRCEHETLLEKTQYLKTIIDNLFTYASLLDLEGRVLEVNNAPLDRAGLQRKDVVGKLFHQAPWWSYDDQVQAQLLTAMAAARTGKVVRYDVDVKMGDEIVPIDFQIAPVRDEQGMVVALIPTAVDISKRRRAEMQSQRHKQMIDQAFDAVMVVDMSGLIVETNLAQIQMTGFSREELIGMPVKRLDALESAHQVEDHIARIVAQGHDAFETLHRHKDGHVIDVHVSATYMPETQNVFAIVQDISERKTIEEDRRIASATFETHEAIMVTDAHARILRVNKAFQRITGYGADEVQGRTPQILKSGRHDAQFYKSMWQQLINDGTWEGEIWDRRKNGQIYPKWATITALRNNQGEITEFVSIFSDITQRKQAEEEIRNLAFYDSLTSLPNRRLLQDRFHVALAVSERSGQVGAVLFLDMDRFKVLNDTLGHGCGDLMLIEVADRIRFSVRDVDTVARLGGDEFVVLVENLGTNMVEASQRIAMVAEKIRAALVAPYKVQDHVHHSSPSIGVCLFQGAAVAAGTLLKHADTAMYQAKSAGRNTVRFFDPALQVEAEARATLENELRQAVSGGQFCLYYQVQSSLDGQAMGAEALIRWMHPTRGIVLPSEFIPIAEESSLILEIGNWVLNSACHQLALWAQNPATDHLVLAINVSAKQFRAVDFVTYVERLMRQYGVNATRLKLELTESLILDDVNDVVVKMQALKKLGVQLSLDDFGTGYSSLSYLKRLPLDQIKIDGSFVRDVAVDGNDAIMVQAILDMAKNFRLHVIAEGVETQEQLSFLRMNGCSAFQGYLFSHPVPVEQFETLMAANTN